MNFYRPFLILFLWMTTLVSSGCGEINQPETVDATDTKLSGQWIAVKLNGNGDRVLLTFAPDDSTGQVARSATLEAIRPGGGLVAIGSGTYTVQQGTKLLFNLDSIPNFTTAFSLTPSRLTLGPDVYNKVTGSLNGPQVGGQIQITQGSADESVGINSVGTPSSSPTIPGRILVRMKTGEMGVLNVDRPKLSDLPGLFVEGSKTSLSAAAFTQLEIKDQWEQETKEALQDCRAQGMQCSRDVLLSIQSLANPTDPRFNEQWNLEILNATDAWGMATSSQQVVVAVIDTGIVQGHPDLAGRILYSDGYDFVSQSISGTTNLSQDGDGLDALPDDPGDQAAASGGSTWHGTHLSGIIAASTDNSTGMAGLGTANVKILPLRAMGYKGNGTIYDVSQAIYYAAKLPNIAECQSTSSSIGGQTVYSVDSTNCRITTPLYLNRPKADVINLSLGASFPDPTDAQYLNDAINEAVAAGVVVVASAGNGNPGISTANFYPAANPNVLTIGAVYPNLSFARYSNYGSSANNTQFLVAPGGSKQTVGVLSTINPNVQGGYGELVGTSQAAAHVSAVAAMIKAENSTFTPAMIRSILQATAIDLGSTGLDVQYGYGLLNPCGAILMAQGKTPTNAPSLKLSSTSFSFGNLGNQSTVLVTSGCGGTPVTGITATAQTTDGKNWLSATVSSTTSPTQITLNANRSGLANGSYSGTVTVASNVGTATMNVTLTVSTTSTSANNSLNNLRNQVQNIVSGVPGGYKNTTNIGEILILLVDTTTQKTVLTTTTDLTANYNFQFGGVTPGKYILVGGIDKDGDIALSGREIYFTYPSETPGDDITVTSSTRKNDIVINY